MKKLSLYIFLGLLWCNISFANYNCSYDVWFKIGADGNLKKKKISMNISFTDDKKFIKIFDNEFSFYYENFYILENNTNFIQAVYSDSKTIRSFSLNKKTGYSQWSSLWIEGDTTVHHGYCK